MEVRRLFDDIEIDWQRLSLPAPTPEESRSRPLPPPTSLGFIKARHLHSVRSLLSLYDRAVTLGFVSDCEQSRIAFLSTVAYCLRVGKKPAGLLVHLLKKGVLPAKLEDEDRACSALRRHCAKKRRRGSWLVLKKPEMPERE